MTVSRRRVVITGMGGICGAGASADAIIDSAMRGQSAMRPISRFDARRHPARIAAEIDVALGDEEDPYLAWGIHAAREAFRSTGAVDAAHADRIGVFLGTACGSIANRERAWMDVPGERSVNDPEHCPMGADLASNVRFMIGVSGPVLTLNSAFAASADAIGTAFHGIRAGSLDVAVAGGAEAPITPLVLAGFSAMGALSANNDEPELAIRPFDLDRNGCGLGEGAAFLVLEERDRAIARGATILAELAGYGTSADALHITQLPEDGEGLVRSMAMALDDAGVDPDGIGYINAHGTGTAMNDRVETRAIHDVFGQHAERLGVSSTKPITGHMLGAAGAMEAVITIGALRRGMMPPTANWSARDPDCDLDYVPDGARPRRIRVAMSNSMGFGGHNAALVFMVHDGQGVWSGLRMCRSSVADDPAEPQGKGSLRFSLLRSSAGKRERASG